MSDDMVGKLLAPEFPSSSGLALLVVDDEEIIERIFRQRLRKELQQGRVRLYYAPTAERALEILKSLEPELPVVISDLNMPGMGGTHFLEQLQKWPHPVPVYVVSAYESQKYRQRALELGARDFFPKPLDFVRVREILGLEKRP